MTEEVVTEVVESPSTLITEEAEVTEEVTEVAKTEEVTTEETDGTSTEESEGDAPTDYDFTMPEGMEINEPLMEEFKGLAKELGLSQEVGQKLIDLQTKFEQERFEDSRKQWDTMQDEWTSLSKADTEFGGVEMNANLAIAKKTIDQFGTPELKEMLDFTGAGNHPEIIRLFYRVGQAISDDNLVIGGKHIEAQAKDPANILFPNDK
jgi:hypothetical protein